MTNSKKRRSTRRAFGRRALAFGVAMFAMVTLTAVGFAAWLISTNSTAEAPGGIVTQEVRVQNIKVVVESVNNNGKLVNWNGEGATLNDKPEYEIVFAPKDNTKGLVTLDKTTGDKPENLKFSFNGRIENWDRVGKLNFSVRVPGSVVAAAGLVQDPETKKWTYNKENAYIKLPSYARAEDGSKLPLVEGDTWDGTKWTAPISFENISDSGATLVSADLDGDTENTTADKITITKPDTGTTAHFTGIDLAFGWGARYSYINPADTINSNNWANISATGIEKDKDYTTNQIQLELIKLQTIVNGINLDQTYFDSVVLEGRTLTTELNGKTIDQFAALEDTANVQKWLAALQTAVTTTIGSDRPQYRLFIEAIVRS